MIKKLVKYDYYPPELFLALIIRWIFKHDIIRS